MKNRSHLIALAIAFLMQPMLAQAGDAFIVKSPSGRNQMVGAVSREESKEAIRDLPVSQYNNSEEACGEEGLHNLEVELELKTLIQAISSQDKPRRLTDQQSEVLSRTPFCPMFFAHFVVISRLLEGYDLVSVASLARK